METAVAASGDVRKHIARLGNNIIRFEKKVAVLEQENQYLREKLKPALFRQFGRHAEKYVGEGNCRCLTRMKGPRRRLAKSRKSRSRSRATAGQNGGGNRLTSISRGLMKS
jgi:hypothetical protein